MAAAEDFSAQLERLLDEADGASQFLYAYLTLHDTAARRRAVRRRFQQHPLLWNTMLASLQLSTFIVLGRIFDQDPKSKFNVDRLLRVAQTNPDLFSRGELLARKLSVTRLSASELEPLITGAHEPTADDFRRLRKHVARHRKIYDQNYRPIRNLVLAHSGADRSDTNALFSKTRVREVELVIAFLRKLHRALLGLFDNGLKPTLRPVRYSLREMKPSSPRRRRAKSAAERITYEAHDMLAILAREAKADHK
jgi:hypothetical protein